MTKEQSALLNLVRLGINYNAEPCFAFEGVDFGGVFSLSVKHGVGAIVADGLQKLSQVQHDELYYQWIGYTLNAEKIYERQKKVLCDLAKMLSASDIRMMLLKGYGLSLNYPIPMHRPSGDFDIYNFGKYQEADALISQVSGVDVDKSNHHHTISRFEGQMVENHYDFINTKAHKDAPKIEKQLKLLAENAIEHNLDGVKIYLPSATFNAIFLIRHAGQHFAAIGLNLRQVLDWGLFIMKYSTEVDWNVVIPFLKEIGIWDFCCVLNSICVDYLGMDALLFPELSTDKMVEERVLNDILEPEFSAHKPAHGVIRIDAFILRRWWCNRWKHRLIYNERLFPMFLTLAWSHITKPRC